MKLTEMQKGILKKYSISFLDIEYNSKEDANDLLSDIDLEMTLHVDRNGEPLEDFLILQDLYDEILYSLS